VLSPRAVSVLEKAGVDNLQYFPIHIKNRETGELEQSYKIVNVVGLVYCLDKKRATFTTFAHDESKISWLQQYSIFEDMIQPISPSQEKPLIFRLGEFRSHVLAHESIKTTFGKQRITGSEFIPPEDVA
jgi:hypothetical protein